MSNTNASEDNIESPTYANKPIKNIEQKSLRILHPKSRQLCR
jgi:hypothetical protein